MHIEVSKNASDLWVYVLMVHQCIHVADSLATWTNLSRLDGFKSGRPALKQAGLFEMPSSCSQARSAKKSKPRTLSSKP